MIDNGNNSERRSQANLLTGEEEKRVVEIINGMLEKAAVSKEDECLIQKLIDNYQNMLHYVSYTNGLKCTDSPSEVIDPHNQLFNLSFYKDSDD
jgi:hypothetical protein